MRHWLAVSLPLSLTVVCPSLASAQSIQQRLLNDTTSKTQKSKYFRLAQVDVPSGPRGIEPTPPDVTAPGPTTSATTTNPISGSVPSVGGGRKPIVFSVDTRFGFDKAKVFVPAAIPFEVSVKRRIRTMVVSGSYAIAPRTNLSVNVPFISQYTKNSVGAQSISQRGSSVGDVSVWVDHSFPKPRKQLELGVAAGMVFPTGRDPFGLDVDELPTGLGYYQPSVRLSARTTSVPLQFFGSVDYSSSLKANHDGQNRRLPASYGGEAGVFYSLGPEWATQTSISLGKSSSPVLQDSGSTVGYLTQALNYRTGNRTSFRASVDVGLTDDSTDAYAGLSLNSSF